MNEKTKGTIRDDGSVISSGVTPSGTGTQRDTQPVISSGIVPGTPQPQIISSGMSTPGSDIVLNDENYKILKVIAKSTGEAEVYLAEKENQKYVFKYYFPNFKPKDSLLKQLKGLHHDDTVDLIDYGYYCDRFFEVLEYAAGGSLMDVKEDGTYKYIPIKDITRIKQIVKEVVNALNFCHSKGIIHRDLKPENIFFKNPDGTDILIGDFGISSMLDEGLSKHMTGQARTEIYAAPELYQSIGGKTIISKE
ncbi:MAG: protein kinase, partial [Actinobacteria bacterium]|nr:protein kinase [Actinomycetota bacterium]